MGSSLLPVISLLFVCVSGCFQEAQAVKVEHPATASVSGRITVEGSPAASVQVALIPEVSGAHSSIRKAKTDQDGRYLLDSLTSGFYTIQVVAPAMAVLDEATQGRRIAVQESTKLENIDFVLARGGVISGRVTDASGSPVSDLSPTLKRLDEKGRSTQFFPCPQQSGTDDRGIYRIYGLPPGRYIIGFGAEWDGPTHEDTDHVVHGQLYPVTFYPGVLDEAGSKPIDVAGGSEITGMNITLAAKKSLFKATGKVVDADTGAPIAGAAVDLGIFSGNYPAGPIGSVRSDSGGQFKFDRLQTGKHFLKLSNDYSNSSNSFADQITFQISDGDASGLEVRVHHGSTISGLVVAATPEDENAAQSLANRELYAIQLRTDPDTGAVSRSFMAQTPLTGDRNFRLAGLPPGNYRLQLAGEAGDGFGILYIDVPGVGRLTNRSPFPPGSFDGDPIALGGDQVSRDINGLRVAVGEMHGVIQGQLKFEEGPLPQDALMDVSIVMLPGSDTRQYAGATVDPDGRFVVRSLAAGQYLIRGSIYVNPSPGQQGGGIRVIARGSETVSVAERQQTTVTIILKPVGPQQNAQE